MHPDRAVAVVSLLARMMLSRLVWSKGHLERWQGTYKVELA